MISQVNNEKTDRYENIDLLRGFAILLVVLGHAVAKENVCTTDSVVCNLIFDFIYSFHMPLLFAISGFCFVLPERFGAFIKKKSRRLLLPYFIFNVGTVVLQAMLPAFSINNTPLKERIFFIIFEGGDYWFLYVLFFIFIIFALILKYKHNNSLLLIYITVSYGMYIIFPNVSFFCFSYILEYSPFFLVGFVIRENISVLVDKIDFSARKIVWCLLSCFLLQIIWCLFFSYMDGTIIQVLFSFFVALIGSFFAYAVIKLINILPHNRLIKKYLLYLGIHSLEIYLFNGYFISLSRTVIYSMCKISNSFILAVCNIITGLIINSVFVYFIMKNDLIRKICGRW